MMHTFRLLEMAKEIGESGEIVVKRPDREFLLNIKSGKDVYSKSSLPEAPNFERVNELLVGIRKNYYAI
jgi:uncharacterized protein